MATGNTPNKSSGSAANLGFEVSVHFVREIFGKGNDFVEQMRDLLLHLLSGQFNINAKEL
jgi:hypothetical protein